MATPSGDAFAHLASSDDVRYELELQTTIVLSLEDGPQNPSTPAQIREAKQRLATLRRLLKKREAEEQPAVPSSSKQNMNYQDIYSASASGSGNTPSNAYANSGSSRNNLATPSTSSGDNRGTSSSALAQRKRPFPHLDDDDSASSRNKSLRTTPSPSQAQTGATTPFDSYFDDGFVCDDDMIDLTGDDDEVDSVIKRQAEVFKRFEQEKADEQLAKSFLDHGTPNSMQSNASTSAVTGPNAFDRILSRPSQIAAQLPAPSASSEADSHQNFPNSVQQNSYAMPGSFPSSGDDDFANSNYNFMDMYDPNASSRYLPSNNTMGVNALGHSSTPGFPSQSLQQPQFGQPSFSQMTATAANSSPAELARQAALTRQEGYGSFGGGLSSAFTGLPGAAGLPGFGPTSALPGSGVLPPSFDFSFGSANPRPGMLNSGSYNPFQGSSGHSNGLPQASDGGLSSIINQTNNIDWAKNLDALGQPLNPRLRDYWADLQDDPRKTEEEIKDLLANVRPDEEIPVEDRVGTPEALRYPLYPHQQLALKWMTTSEDGKNKGGILADDMGLGKTISTLALMVSRKSSDKIKTTLIVAPVALVRQWEIELSKKVKAGYRPSVFMLHGRQSSYSEMSRFDVVLTTYGKLSFEEKRYIKWIDTHPNADPAADVELAKSCPLLHPKSKFFRVILDEAQCIKNVTTYSARGACRLHATYRWCLTGTPMMNGVGELYSLIKFLKIAPYSNQKEFTKMFGCFSKAGKGRSSSQVTRDRAMQALRVLLRAIMLRRMKTSKLDGKPLLDLPPKTEEVAHVTFEEDEENFYKNLESGARNKFNRYLRAGTVGKNYSNVLVLLLRLRQACCHPHLNLDVEYVGNNEVSEENMMALAKTLQPDVIARLKAANEEGFSCPICLDAVIDPTIVLPCGHNSCTECFSTLVAQAADHNIRDGNEGGGLKCPECRGTIKPDNVINLSAFKAVHMPELMEVADEAVKASDSDDAGDDDSDDSDSDSDPDSDGDDDDAGDADRNGNLRDFIVDDDDIEDNQSSQVKNEDDDDLLDAEASRQNKDNKKRKSKGKGKKNRKGKGKEKREEVKPHMLKTLRIEAKKNKTEYRRYMKYLKRNWQPSAKVTECCRLLENIQQSGDKTIVFSQFTFLLDLLEIPLKYQHKIKYCRYDGGMSRPQRDAAALDFQDSSSPTKVMLVSLKAGNAGLNLTSANHVIIMDPFWNPYIEMQAVDRAHRIGQQKPVQVHRLLVEGTVEDRIVGLQEQKRQFVDAALDEGESKQLGKLSLQDLTYLFNGSRN